uniref:Uncharacterized protein n=1 Tax=Glyptapanteles flavicoxis TaxID=463051 RepID=B7S8L9_9HYME|nr:hypothetical protein GFP_L2_0180 [Glyptapanteles flavicoxis]
MSLVRSQSSIVNLHCLIPNGWRDHPERVTRLILVQEFRQHLQKYQTKEGRVVDIDDVTAKSQAHYNFVWFQIMNREEVEPDLMEYYPMKIQVHVSVMTSRS